MGATHRSSTGTIRSRPSLTVLRTRVAPTRASISTVSGRSEYSLTNASDPRGESMRLTMAFPDRQRISPSGLAGCGTRVSLDVILDERDTCAVARFRRDLDLRTAARQERQRLGESPFGNRLATRPSGT